MSQIIDQPQASIWLAPIFKGGGIVDCKLSEKIDYKNIKTGDIIELRGSGEERVNRGRTYIAAGNWNASGNGPESGSGFCVLMSLSGSRLTVSGKMLHSMDINLIGSLAAA